MRKIGILLTSSVTKGLVVDYISKPLRKSFRDYISANDDILKSIRNGEKEKVKKLVIEEVRKFKKRKIYNIVFACSSISNLKNIAITEGVRIFTIDNFLKKETKPFKKIAFLATVPSALENSHNLFSSFQTIECRLIDKAFEYLLKGKKEKHNKIIVNYLDSLPRGVQCIVLAQISMFYALDDILRKVDIPVLSGAMTLVKNLLFQKEPKGIKLYNSISYIKENDKNKFIISGSHGGLPSVKYAVEKKVFGAVFNDAGVGKNKAGISGLSVLTDNGILGITVDANTAEIGNAEDTYENGVVSFYNTIAEDFGVQTNMKIKDFLRSLSNWEKTI